ncbi:MAG: prephenate dehydrogenase [Leptospirillia bacterium]
MADTGINTGALPRLGRVLVVGVGMIGGSLGMRLRRSGACGEVIGSDSAPLDEALNQGAIDRAGPLEDLASQADLVILCTPVGTLENIARNIAPHLKPEAVVTDVGSVKGDVVAALAPLFKGRFVGAHPIAGKESSGVAAADPDLFEGANCILTPEEHTDPDATERVEALWRWAGSNLIRMIPEVHDRVFASVSHLPHLVAYALMDTVSRAGSEEIDPVAFAAGGLKDFTRVAASNATMWRDICLHNREAILESLDGYRKSLEQLQGAIENGDGNALEEVFSQARSVRERLTR